MTPRRSTAFLLAVAPWLAASPARAFFVDGEGYYGLRGETRTNEAFSRDTGTYQAIEQTFRLQGEARFNDQSSLFLEFHLFDDPRAAYLGDPVAKSHCDPATRTPGDPKDTDNIDKPCPGDHQNTGEPRYQAYTPRVTKAFVRYAFDYCIVEAGRRPRQWGLGIFMDAGTKPFDTDATVFDGITCNVNIQKTQTLGFSVGYDKLAETGTEVYLDPTETSTRRFGANDSGDDIDQYFFTIEYDDRKAHAGAALTKQIGVYFAQVSSRALKDGGSDTDLKFLDLYTAFYFADLSLRNELLFRMGKSADPNWQTLGGAQLDEEGDVVKNKLNAIGLAGGLDWTLSRSGAAIGPAEYNRGDAKRHVLFFNYAYAPGDSDGYKQYADNADVTGSGNEGYRFRDRDSAVEALAFHRNFKPALLLFNGRPESEASYSVDGAFNPSRVENATVYSLGYRYESMEAGSFESKLVTASLNQGTPGTVKNYFDMVDPEGTKRRPAGFYGTGLGYELDLSYAYKVGREAELGVAGAAALPGDAWKVDAHTKPATSFLLQSYVSFNF